MPKHLQAVAVVTADIIGSREYSQRDRAAIDVGLRRAITIASAQYRQFIHTDASFRVTIGDEFQWVIGAPDKAFEILIYLRSLVATLPIDPMVSFRAGIGIGAIAVQTGKTSYQKDGSAFVHSRSALDRLRNERRWTALRTGERFRDDVGDGLLALLDSLQKRWTRPQWAAVRWAILGLKRHEIAKRVQIAH